ncbi:MAG: glycosyltransferase family 4 protein [Pseudomonadota bacterium]
MSKNKKLRVLFVSQSFPPDDKPLANVGGMQRVSVGLHKALSARADIELDSLVLKSSWRWHNYITIFWLWQTLWRIRRKALRGDFDVVLFSSMVTGAMATPLRPFLAARGIKMAAIAHGRDVTRGGLYQPVMVKPAIKALDLILPVSTATGDACRARGCPNEKIEVVPNGINAAPAALSSDRRASRAANLRRFYQEGPALDDDALLLCSVGRQVPRKGFAWFVDEVMPNLPDNVHYWLAGQGPEGPAIASAVERRGLHGRVRMLGRVSDDALSALYRSADLFIMPNIPIPEDMEGFGIVMLEAGLAGAPAIAARLEGIQDVVTDGENGHLVPCKNAWAFSEAILPYHQNPKALEAASQRAIDHTVSTFGWTAVAARYENQLRTLLAPNALTPQTKEERAA